MKLRKGVLSDNLEIMRLNAQIPNSNWKMDDYQSYYERHDAIFMVAQIDATIVGFVLWVVNDDFGELYQICVDVPFRHLGIGKKLIDASLKMLSGNTEVFLEVSETNQAAIAFYERLGFTLSRIRRDYYGPNNHALVLRKGV